jgi:hypothetical protein
MADKNVCLLFDKWRGIAARHRHWIQITFRNAVMRMAGSTFFNPLKTGLEIKCQVSLQSTYTRPGLMQIAEISIFLALNKLCCLMLAVSK